MTTFKENKNTIHNSLIFNCNCLMAPGIIIHNNKAFCRWCKKELIKGGSMVYNSDCFDNKKEKNEC